MQTCPNCGATVTGKFCTSCGTKVEGNVNVGVNQQETTPEAASPISNSYEQPNQTFSQEQHYQAQQPYQPNANPQHQTQPNPYFEQGKKISKNYFDFFINLVKKPTSAQDLNHTSMTNGLITSVLYALLYPLMVFFFLKAIERNMWYYSGDSDIKFSEVFFEPALYVLLFIAIIIVIQFAVLKLSNPDISFQDVLARFGAFLVVPTVFMLITLVLTWLKAFSVIGYTFAIGFVGLLVTIAFTTYSFKRENQGGIDPIYSTLIIYVASFIALKIFAENMVINELMSNMF